MKYLLFFLLMSSSCYAGQLNFKIGPTINTDRGFSNKLSSFGYGNKLSSLFEYQLEGGAFTSLTNSEVYFASAQLGLVIKGRSLYSKMFTGPTYVSNTNEYLNTPIVLGNDLEFGIHDDRGVEFGVDYKHFSNGGVTSPNLGRDFLLLKVAIPFGGK